MSAKRNPQTAAKRAREQAVREKRELKAAKKQARREAGDVEPVPGFGLDEPGLGLVEPGLGLDEPEPAGVPAGDADQSS